MTFVLERPAEIASIYILVDPRDGRVRYVGQTIRPILRSKQHTAPSECKFNPDKMRWTRELRDAGMRPRFIVIGEVGEREGGAAEREAISFYLQAGAPLLNMDGTPREKRRRVGGRGSGTQCAAICKRTGQRCKAATGVLRGKFCFYHRR